MTKAVPRDQPDLFKRGPSKASVAARRSLPVRPMTIEPFDFAASHDPRAVPQPDVIIPDELRLPTDDPDWMPSINKS